MTRDLPARSTRGKRMNQLVGEEALVDDEFWKMDMFKEDELDEEYKSEAEEEDVIDADFDNPEEAEAEEEVQVDKEKKEKKRMAYVDPKSKKAPKRRRIQEAKAADTESQKSHKEGDSDIEVDVDAEMDDKKGNEKKGRRRRPKKKSLPLIDLTLHGKDEGEGEDEGEEDGDNDNDTDKDSSADTPKSTRKSTRAVAVQRAAEREKERVEVEKKRSLRPKRKSSVVVRRITQEELLEEAKATEIFNTESLKYILSMEEEKKKVKEAPTILGPVIKYYSKDGRTCLCFDELPDVLLQPTAPPTAPPQQTCPITGLPAKYRDPKTGICYANLAAFKTLRTNLLYKDEADCNEKIAQLSVLLQESRHKKELLQKEIVV